jgi:hypothetical protein
MSVSQLSKSRRSFLLVIVVFVLPVLLAKLALTNHWFDYGVTNKGALSKQELTLADLGLSVADFDEQWLMLYRVPEHCDLFCQQALLNVNNAYVLLGKEMPRVTPVALSANTLTQLQQENLRHSKWKALPLPTQAQSLMGNNEVIIVDPLGNVVMSHQTPVDEASLALFGKAILADMKKLLKYSRIG